MMRTSIIRGLGHMTLAMCVSLCLSSSSQAQAGCDLDFEIDGGCISDDNGWVAILNQSGGTTPWSILWSTGDVVQYVPDIPSGTYSATVTDALGCAVTKSITIDCDFGTDCQLRTQSQGGWGSPPNGNNPGMYLHNNFASCFPNGLTIGCNNTLTLTSAQAVTDYLPAGGKSKALPNGTMTDPVGYKNNLAAQLTAASLSVGFDACDPNFGAASMSLGASMINTGTFSGWSVQQLLDEANNYIGGCGSAYSANQLKDALDMVNNNYLDGSSNNGNLDCKKKDDPKSLAAITTSNKPIVYPNPASDRATLELTPSLNGTLSIMMIDMTGRTVIPERNLHAEAGIQQRVELELSDLHVGTYLVVMQLNGQTRTERVMITR